MKILITGFDPFGGESVNPSFEAVKQTAAPEGTELVKLQVPTVFGASAETVINAMEQEHPDAVILVGQAGGRSAVTPERVAINLMDATIADNAGYEPHEEPVVPGGPDAFFSTLPVKAITEAIQAAGVPSQVSNTAGTFVCNQLLYRVLKACSERFPHTRACFIHVPFLPEQVAQKPQYPSMELTTMMKALNAAIARIAR